MWHVGGVYVRYGHPMQVLVFSEKKAEVDDIHEYLLLKGVQAVSIHGSKGLCGLLLSPTPPATTPLLPWFDVVVFVVQTRRSGSGPFESTERRGRMCWWLLTLHPKVSTSLTSNTSSIMTCLLT